MGLFQFRYTCHEIDALKKEAKKIIQQALDDVDGLFETARNLNAEMRSEAESQIQDRQERIDELESWKVESERELLS